MPRTKSGFGPLRREASAFEPLRRKVCRQVEIWCNSIREKPLPIPLHELAKARNITTIQFKPLISTAGLKKTSDGYVIVVNSFADGVTQPTGTEMPPSDAWAKFLPPLRFSIAHEIAHVLLYDCVNGQVDNCVFTEYWQDMEATCNYIAGVLLLPKDRLLRDLRRRPFGIENVVALGKSFRASPEVVLRRLKNDEVRKHLNGIDEFLAIVRPDDGRPKVIAPFCRGERATTRFSVAEKAELSELRLPTDIEESLRETRTFRQIANISWHLSQVIECEVKSRALGMGSGALLLSIKFLGDPENSNKFKLDNLDDPWLTLPSESGE